MLTISNAGQEMFVLGTMRCGVDRVEDGAVDLPRVEVEGGREAVGEQEAEREADDVGAGLGVG